MEPLGVFASAFAVTALAGLAALLRASTPPTPLKCLSAALNAGMLGLGVSLVWYVQYRENVYFLVGVCVLLGLGGTPAIEFVLSALRRGGLTIAIDNKGGLSTRPGTPGETPAAEPEPRDD